MCEQVSAGVLSGFLKAAAFIARPLVTSKVGQKLFNLLPGQIAIASLDSFGKTSFALAFNSLFISLCLSNCCWHEAAKREMNSLQGKYLML